MPTTPGLVQALRAERLVASYRPALMPSAAAANAAAQPRWSTAVPLPRPAARLAHGISPLDRSGRVYDARLFAALGWSAGHTVRACWTPAGVLLGAAGVGEDHGAAAIDVRGRIKLPLASRRLLSAMPGEQLWLVANPAAGTLLVSSCARLDTLAAQPLPAQPTPGTPAPEAIAPLTLVGAP